MNNQSYEGDELMMDARGAVFMNIEVCNPDTNASKVVKFLVDTGFNGFLQLPKGEAEVLGLGVQRHGITIVSDGRAANLDMTTATLHFLGEDLTDVLIQVEEKGLALIGSALLKRANILLTLDYEDGYVTITRDEKVKTVVKKNIEVAVNGKIA